MEVCSLLACSIRFLLEPGTTSSEMAPPTMGLALPQQSPIKKVLTDLPIAEPFILFCFYKAALAILELTL